MAHRSFLLISFILSHCFYYIIDACDTDFVACGGGYEGDQCTTIGNKIIAYGIGNKWSYYEKTGGVAVTCNDLTFGDPDSTNSNTKQCCKISSDLSGTSGLSPVVNVVSRSETVYSYIKASFSPQPQYMKMTLTVSASVTLDNCASSFDTKLWLRNSEGQDINPIDCDGDDCGCGLNEQFTVSLEPGDYYIQIQAWSSNEGLYTLSITSSTAAPTASPTTRNPSRNPTPAPTPPPTPMTPSPTPAPTPSPTLAPTPSPTPSPTPAPTYNPTRNPTPAPTSNPTPAPTNIPTPSPTADIKTSCGADIYCYYVDLHPMIGSETSAAVSIADINDSAPTTFEIHYAVHDTHCVNPSISFSFQELHTDTQYVELFDNDGSSIRQCRGSGSIATCDWSACFPALQPLNVDRIATDEVYVLSISEPINVEQCNGNALSINAQLIIYCSGDTASPTHVPSTSPTPAPTMNPTLAPSMSPTLAPSNSPTAPPSSAPSRSPSSVPSNAPSQPPTRVPSYSPTVAPSNSPSNAPSKSPTFTVIIAPPISPPSRAPTMLERSTEGVADGEVDTRGEAGSVDEAGDSYFIVSFTSIMLLIICCVMMMFVYCKRRKMMDINSDSVVDENTNGMIEMTVGMRVGSMSCDMDDDDMMLTPSGDIANINGRRLTNNMPELPNEENGENVHVIEEELYGKAKRTESADDELDDLYGNGHIMDEDDNVITTGK